MRLGFLLGVSNISIRLLPGYHFLLLCNQGWRFGPGSCLMLRYLQCCMYHFIVATFFLGLVVGLHDGGYLLLAFRDQLFDLMVSFIIFVLLPSANFLACNRHLWWCSLLAFLLAVSFLLSVWLGARLLTCVLFAVRCGIMFQYQLNCAIPSSRNYHDATDSSLKAPVLTRIRP